ncbi:MAG: hypothetical protein U0V48_08325 [Anaerolineales bacterium]
MNSEDGKTASKKRTALLGSSLILGLLVSVLSVLTAAANYMAYQEGNSSLDNNLDGDRALAESNTLYLEATQYIIVDYNMYDGYQIQSGLDDVAAEYYHSQFSAPLLSSIERDGIWDDQYYDEMYTDALAKRDEAFAFFDEAKRQSERESGYQLSMLIAAVGLAFAAYASLMDETKRLRSVFALISILLFAFSAFQFAATYLA